MMPWFGLFSELVWMNNADEETQAECIMFIHSYYLCHVCCHSQFKNEDSVWGLKPFFFLLLQTILGILGICGNIVAGFILSRREMQNAFNLLLVILACFDSTYVSTMSFRATEFNLVHKSKIEKYIVIKCFFKFCISFPKDVKNCTKQDSHIIL